MSERERAALLRLQLATEELQRAVRDQQAAQDDFLKVSEGERARRFGGGERLRLVGGARKSARR